MPVTINGTTGASLVESGALPFLVGQVCFFAMGTAPDGFLKANGAEISRSTYADLFAAIGTTFGSGDGSTTFNLPDMRGEFPRGWDDGRGVDSGRSFATAQAGEIGSHKHNLFLSQFKNDSGSAGSIGIGESTAATGVPRTVLQVSAIREKAESRKPTWDANGRNPSISIDFFGGSETRSRNIALLACIKF